MMVADRSVANQDATSLLRWVWRSYFRAALIPLLVVEVVFIAIYLAANHRATQENLAAVRPAGAVAQVVEGTAGGVKTGGDRG